MNDTKKKIDVNMTSLDRLKAELLRKQEEIKKAKIQKPIENFVPKKPEEKPKIAKEKTEKKSKTKEPQKNYEEYEDSSAFEKAKRVLQAKAKFYDKMVASGGSLNSDDNCLVLFNKKQQEDRPILPIIEDDYNDDDDDVDAEKESELTETANVKDSNETIQAAADFRNLDYDEYQASEEGVDWVEYTDCLGRTRKCLRKDFVFCKQRDTELAKTIQIREGVPNPLTSNPTAESAVPGSMSSLEASVRTKYEEMKDNWEQKEKENLDKEFIHYQDVFFDEARQHGTGYYAFSTDDEERARQLKELYELRAETLEEQKKREAERQQRDIILSERVRAAENRLRARQGLPPLEDNPTPQEQKPLTKEELKHQKKEAKFRRRQERKEKLKEEQRKNHIRPWDKPKVGKRFKKKGDGSSSDDSDSDASDRSDGEWKYRPQREPMSQEQWNEKQRSSRNPEFAPPTVNKPAAPQRYNEPPPQPPMHNFPPPTHLPPPSYPPPPLPTKQQKSNPFSANPTTSKPQSEILDDLEEPQNSNPFFFTTKKRPAAKKNPFVRKNYGNTEPEADNNDGKNKNATAPVQSRLYDDYDDDIRPPGVASEDDDQSEDDEPRAKQLKGVEIPPPPTFEYYGPTNTSARRGPVKKPDIESSIEAGLKFLRKQSDKGVLPKKSTWDTTEDF